MTCLKTFSTRNLRETPNDISKRKSIDLQKLHLPEKLSPICSISQVYAPHPSLTSLQLLLNHQDETSTSPY